MSLINGIHESQALWDDKIKKKKRKRNPGVPAKMLS